MRRLLTLAILVVATTTGFARPMRDGANHHLGDDSFVVRFGRVPTPADGAVLFFSIEREGAPADDTTGAAAERAAQAAGGWLLGARATKLDAYLRGLREVLDPKRIMNPGTLA